MAEILYKDVDGVRVAMTEEEAQEFRDMWAENDAKMEEERPKMQKAIAIAEAFRLKGWHTIDDFLNDLATRGVATVINERKAILNSNR